MKRLIATAVLLLLTACGGPRVLHLPWGAEGYALAFAPDGKALLVLYSPGTVECRDLPGGRVRWRVEGLWDGLRATFSPDGQEVAVSSEGRLLFYDADDGEPRGEIDLVAQQGLDIKPPLYSVLHIQYLSADRLALLTQHRNILFLETWNRDGSLAGEVVSLGDRGNPDWWHPFSRDGSQAAYVGYDTLGLVDVAAGECREWNIQDQLPAYRHVSTLALSLDGDEVAVGLADMSYLWSTPDPHPRIAGPMILRFDTCTGEILSRHDAPDDALPVGEMFVSLAYSPDGRFLAATTLNTNGLFLYNLADTKAEPQVLCRGEDCCRHFPLFSPDGSTLATVCGRRITLWNMGEQK